MYVIITYDVHRRRIHKVHKTIKRYLFWVQNSVFEGELTMAQLKQLKYELDEIIKPNYDSIIFYIFPNNKYLSKKFLGIDKSWLTSNIL